MRETVELHRKWAFSMDPQTAPDRLPERPYWVNLPHTWNAIDGQDGGGDYDRGTCWYIRTLDREDIPAGDCLYLEITGANASADVYVDGQRLAHHDGGYAAWRVNVTDCLHAGAVLAIAVDNAPSDTVYPQLADFTFYGGLYRSVRLIGTAKAHFTLDYFGGPGVSVTPVMVGEDAHVTVETWPQGASEEHTLALRILDAQGTVAAQREQPAGERVTELLVPQARRWHGKRDPYLYTLEASLLAGGEVLDSVSLRFGCRSFAIDPERGFFLNGEAYPLRGVSRHQDWWGVGNALLPEHHETDMAHILDLGATSVRLAHYQHDAYFYDLCDAAGLVVWAEIPYISQHLPGGRDNAVTQLTELIVQNHHHPSIVVWGLSNEITMKGEEDPALLDLHRELNDLAHRLDPTRKTVVAAVSMCDMNAAYLRIPDAVAYNHYFGWYGGDVSMNGPWFDRFHQAHPELPIAVSEYGCEALNWHTSQPEQGDYTEEYQAYYHESLIRQLYTRPYLWATYVWNMFDFGADNRAEGGENGQNHKGLVTFDRAYRKDAFYAYKAWLSDEPFVHLCGKRYIDRTENVTRVTVYSNQPEVELFLNGRTLGRKAAEDHFFHFDVPNIGRSRLRAVAGDCTDEGELRKVPVFNEAYRLKEKNAVLNWYDVTTAEGFYSLHDKVSDVMRSQQARALLEACLHRAQQTSGDRTMGVELTPAMLEMLGSFTLLRLTSLMGAANVSFSREQLLELNAQLNQIPRT